MDLTINDFRNILGKVNDGNVIFTEDNKLQKVNYGGLLSRKIHGYATAANDADMNIRVRQAFYAAISSSLEARGMAPETLEAIAEKLGLWGNAAEIDKPLMRRTISEVFDMVGKAVHPLALIQSSQYEIHQLGDGVFDRKKAKAAYLALKEAMPLDKTMPEESARLFQPNEFGHSRKEYAKFIRGNDAAIKMKAFDRLYWQAMEGKPLDGKAAYRESLIEMMTGYAEGKLPVLKTDRLASLAKPPAVEVPENLKVRFEAVSKNLADQLGALTRDMPKGSYGRMLVETLAAHLKAELTKVFVSVHDANRNDPDAADIAEQAYRDQADGITAMLKGLEEVKSAWQTQPGGSDLSFSDILVRLIDQKFGTLPYGEATPSELAGTLCEIANELAECSTTRLATGFCESVLTDDATRAQVQKPFLEKVLGDVNPVDLNQVRIAFVKEKLGLPDPGMTRAKDAAMSYLNRQLGTVRNSLETPEQVKARKDAALTSIYGACKDDALEVATRTLGWNRGETLGILKNGKLAKGGAEKLRAELEGYSAEDLEQLVPYVKLSGREMDNELENHILRLKMGYSYINAVEAQGTGVVKPPLLTAIKNGTFKAEAMTETFCWAMKEILAGGLRLSAAQNMDGADEDPNHGSTFLRKLMPSDVFSSEAIRTVVCEMADRFLAKAADQIKAAGNNGKLNDCKRAIEDYKSTTADPAASDEAKAVTAREIFDTFGVQVWGFGVTQFEEMLPLLSRCGVKLEDLNSPDLKVRATVAEKLLTLMSFSQLNGHHIDELPEYIERMTGKPVAEVRVDDLAQLMVNRQLGIANEDPNTTLEPEQAKLPDALRGLKKFSQVGATVADIAALHKAIATFKREGRAELTMFGVTGSLVRRADGEIDLAVGAKALFHLGDSLDRLSRIAEDELVAVAAKLKTPAEKESLVSILPPVPQPGSTTNLLRARELYVKTVAAKLNVPTSTLSSVPTARLRTMAVEAMRNANPPAFPELSAPPSQQFNSEEMVEMHQKMLNTSAAVVDAKVQMPKVTSAKSLEERQAAAFTGETARKVLADLFMNQDTWSFDAISKNPDAPKGDRIKNILAGYGPELVHLKAVVADETQLQAVVADLPPVARGELTEILKAVVEVDFKKMTEAQFAALENRISSAVDRIMTAMQKMVSEMFKAKEGPKGPAEPWQQSLKDVGGTSVGIDTTTTQGLFVKNVIDHYFVDSKSVDKRAMLAAFLRNTDGSSTDGKQVAELLKGAGPLLQKTLQGLPIDTFPPETQLALKDMKSKLAPIPEDAVRAQMLELVDSSNGLIRSIEVKKSAGAASVAQTFICNMKTDDNPVDGVDCVIKVLRPSAQTAIRREKALFDQVIAADKRLAAMRNPFDGQFKEILKELDFTTEAKNVETGVIGYERPNLGADVATEHLHSMQLMKGCVPTMGAMVVSKANGETIDSYVGNTLAKAKAVVAPLTKTTQLGVDGPKVTVCHAPDVNAMKQARQEIEDMVKQTLVRRQELAKTLDAWFTRAVYKDGFFHADMHAGNIMTAPDATTIIDFGNCMTLDKTEQAKLKFVVLACRLGNSAEFSKHFEAVLPEGARAAFTAAYTAHKSEFEEIFRKGSPNDMVPRFFAAMTRLQELGVAVPTSLYAFTQSYGRLAAAVTEMDELLVSLRTMAASIGLDPAAQGRIADGVGEQPKLVALFQKMADVAYCTEGGSFTAESLDFALDEIKDYLNSDQGKLDLRDLASDTGKAKEVLQGLMDKLGHLTASQDGTIMQFGVFGDRLKELVAAAVEHDEESVEYIDAQTDLPREFISLALEVHSFLRLQLASDVIPYQPTPEEILASATKREMASILSDTKAAMSFASSYAGFIGAFSLEGRITAADDQVERISDLESDVKRTSSERNNSLPMGVRLTGLQLNAVRKIRLNDFRAPADDQFAKAGWHTDSAKVDLMLRILKFNLKRLSKGLKIEAGAPIPEGAIRIAFGEFAATYRVGEFAKTLSNDVKGVLLVRAGDNLALQTAVNAL